METLQVNNIIPLQSHVGLYIPCTDENNAQVIQAKEMFKSLFGDVMEYEAQIDYTFANPLPHRFIENVIVIEAYPKEKQLNNSIADVLSLCDNLKGNMSLDEIKLDINNKIYTV